MSRIDHAAAHERLADLALEPGALERLAGAVERLPAAGNVAPPEVAPASAESDEASLADHVRACARCRADLDGWRQTYAALATATAADADAAGGRLGTLAGERPIAAPAALRSRIKAAIHAEATERAAPVGRTGMGNAATSLPRSLDRDRAVEPASRPALPSRSRGLVPGRSWRVALPLVAALALAVGGLVTLRDQASRLDTARADAAALTSLATTVDRVLADPSHHVVPLTAADGSAQGTLAWSTHDLVVMTAALASPPEGKEYRCWVERGGVRTRVGTMWFAGDLAYWNGSLDDWATISLEGGGRFGVSLEPATGGGGSSPVLLGDLPA